MCNFIYLICLTSPFEKDPFLFCKDEKGISYTRDITIIDRYDKIISYGFENVVERRRGKKIPISTEVVDVVTAKKLLAGNPKGSYKNGREPWNLNKIVGRESSKNTRKWLKEILQLKITQPDKYDDFEGILQNLMSAFERTWEQIKIDLREKNEYERFFNLEVPIYNIFLKAQYRGIGVSQTKLKEKLFELKQNYYSSIKNLELKYGFVSQKIKPNMRWSDVEKYTSISWNMGDVDSDFWQYAKIFAEKDTFFNSLVVARNSDIDYNALIKYCVCSYSKIYPLYDVHGTVTSRIMVARPGVQYLKKASRSIFTPDERNCFLYADFDQFEPGIVAHLSGDQKLIKLYNSGDVYEKLSYVLFNSKAKRKYAKTIFLAFLYGMKEEGLGNLIRLFTNEDAEKQTKAFFNEFKELMIWREKVCEEAFAKGYSTSVYGNRRYLSQNERLAQKERRWIPNQIIQGTASFIFKKSLLRVDKEIDYAYLLIPMHDAILLEVPINKEVEAKQKIAEIFNSIFKEICPSINTGVSFEDFSG